jgi:hypothetical protein
MLGFESRFWPEEMFDVVCTDSYLPEIWTIKPEGFRDERGQANYLITGFVAGDAADKVRAPQPTAPIRPYDPSISCSLRSLASFDCIQPAVEFRVG